MFPVDSLPPGYCEERAAAESARLRARQQEETVRKAQEQAVSQQHYPQPLNPQTLTQALLQRPPLSRPGSSSVLGNIFQGFVRAASASPSRSGSQTPMTSPSLEKRAPNATDVSKEMEKLIAERRRDADVVMSHWYH